jgi:membrane-bound metal-dependent hydrolase YbcI (DUF457 family)
MPSPLGHTAIGLATHALYPKGESVLNSRRVLVLVAVLANLPDIDVLVGLIFQGNGGLFHRGPTHSLVFALATALLCSNAWRWGSKIPRVGFLWCFAVIVSHVLADAAFTSAPVSWLWPLEVHWSGGFCGWQEVMGSVFLGVVEDLEILGACALLLVIYRLRKSHLSGPTARTALSSGSVSREFVNPAKPPAVFMSSRR